MKGYVHAYALDQLNRENSLKSRISIHPEYEKLEIQEYFLYLPPADARLYFQVRCQIADLKTLRKYKYGEDDTRCRLCEKEDETLDHVVNKCEKIKRTDEVPDIFSSKREDVMNVVARMKMFTRLVEELDISEAEAEDHPSVTPAQE